ncbi:MAG: hypothetical protein ACFFFD_02945, partial [Promethearchaeota archaeon]
IKAALISSATHLSSESWEVGAGLLNTRGAMNYVSDANKKNELPLVAALTPGTGPYSFERWFVNSSTIITYSVFCSSNASFRISYLGSAADWVHGPSMFELNQTGSFQISIYVQTNESQDSLNLTVMLYSSTYGYHRADMTFDAATPLAMVAFDISHSPWVRDSIYGQFREMYSLLSSAGIAIEELRYESQITVENLGRYDAIFILDPCAWGSVYRNGEVEIASIHSYSQAQKNAYLAYWESGGSILVAGMGNRSLNLNSTNELLLLFGFSLNYDQIPEVTIEANGISSTLLVTDLMNHTTTSGIGSFDFVGCSVNFTGNASCLAQVEITYLDGEGALQTENRTVMAALEGLDNARMIVSGTNFLFDNWGVKGYYQSEENDLFILQIAYWLVGIT